MYFSTNGTGIFPTKVDEEGGQWIWTFQSEPSYVLLGC
jgi:hypothetical protein